MKMISNIIVNWIMLITMPAWILPAAFYIFYHDGDMFHILIGKRYLLARDFDR